MPSKLKLTKEEIERAALDIIREGGEAALNARSLAARLSSSTQPIFSNFKNMDDVRGAAKRLAYGAYLDFIDREIRAESYPSYKASGMAYIRFAVEEPEAFKLLFMRERCPAEFSWDSHTEGVIIPAIMKNLDIDRAAAQRFHLEMWALVHGIAVMYASSYLSLDEASVSTMLSDVYRGLCFVYKEGK